MIAYVIDYKIIKSGRTKSICVNAKNIKSAKNKIEKLEAKRENETRPQSKQTTKTRVEILHTSIIGYY